MERASWYKSTTSPRPSTPKSPLTAWDPGPADEFERRLNGFLVGNGIGWELRGGRITRRGMASRP